jgi:hypothetical protein
MSDTYKEIKAKYAPKVSGLYYARKYTGDKWYFYVVHVVGEAPFLRVEQGMDLRSGQRVPSDSLLCLTWGPKIEEAKISDDEIETTKVY